MSRTLSDSDIQQLSDILGLTPSNTKTISLWKSEVLKLSDLLKQQAELLSENDRLKISDTRTSIGNVIKVSLLDKEFDITDYGTW